MKSLRVVSLNLGQVEPLDFNGKTVYTGIFKRPVNRPVTVKTLTLEGDSQVDLVNHGGARKAVYFYPSEHYPFWADLLNVKGLEPGALGENFTSIGLLEAEAYVGDRWKLGSAIFEITQPRSPCYKLALKYQRNDLVARFLEAIKPGFYASVIEEGVVAPGDALTLVSSAPERISVHDVFRLAVGFESEPDLRLAIFRNERIPEFWRRKVLSHGGTQVLSMMGRVK
ncbi:MOSC domain-containing protein [Granulicella sp. S190]|uniref:MOSC domain-containing protein n=1 Tax=Granulicella sp. S190 TaxID=1747226 RepID=UPI00131DDF56|nr:MOSC domain-containing protein [Granulicella sp. S190]